ncbi:MAG: LCP family protein, partial [Candidatus Dormibacteraeota bacterium]|nr:LCP family protein [Candidatus Dormibacteraeota bacterium]
MGLTALGFLLSGVVGAGAYFLPLFVTAAKQTSRPPAPTTTAPAVAPGSPFTILLLGSDNDTKFPKDKVLTQSMILVRVNPTARTVTMLSIPRDLWVPLSSGHNAKIDLAYQEGGAKAAIDTVAANFKVKIDDYAWIGLKGLVQLIDRLGGIDLVTTNPVFDDYYPSDLAGGDPYGFQRVAVLAGPQHLDGLHALEYVRSRHNDIREDFGRSERQQQVLLAIRARAAGLGLADLPDLATTFAGEFQTSLSLGQLRELLPLAKDFNPAGVHQVFLAPPYTSSATIEG